MKLKQADIRIWALGTVLIGGMGQGVVAPKLPELLHHSDALARDSGFSATLMYFGIFISTFAFGKIADRGKVHWLMAPGLLTYAATLILMGLVPSQWAFFILRFIEGLTLSAIYLAADFILGRLSAAEVRGQWLSYYGVALSIGLMLGPTLALGSQKLFSRLTMPFSAASPMVPLSLVAAFASIMGVAFVGKRVAVSEESLSIARPLNWAALYSGATYGFMEAGLVAVFPILAVVEFKVLPEYCLITLILSAALSSVGWGILSDRWQPKTVVKILLGMLGVGTASLASSVHYLSPVSIAFTSSIWFGILAGGLYPVGFTWLLESLPQSQYGYASGAFARAYGIGSLIGPLVCGIVAQSYLSAGLFCSLALTGGIGFLVIAIRKIS